MINAKPKPFLNIGPGRIVRKAMTAMGWNQEDLADILEMSPKSISQIINNKQAITVDTAILLGKAFDTSPEFWMNLEQNYRLRLKVSDTREQETETKAHIRKYMPLADLKRKGWVDYGRSATSQIKAFRDFWARETPDFSMYAEQAAPFYPRKTGTDEEFTRYYSQTWLRKAQIEAGKITVSPFDRDKLQNLARDIPDLTREAEGIRIFIDRMQSAGVKFFVLSHLEKTYLDGASFLNNGNPVIIYTGRHKNIDSFWWTVTHEIAHVLQHLIEDTDCFLDNLDEDTTGDVKETEADKFCREIMGIENLLNDARPYQNHFTKDRLMELTAKNNLEPSLVLGILQFNKLVTYRTPLNRFKSSVFEKIPKRVIKG